MVRFGTSQQAITGLERAPECSEEAAFGPRADCLLSALEDDKAADRLLPISAAKRPSTEPPDGHGLLASGASSAGISVAYKPPSAPTLGSAYGEKLFRNCVTRDNQC